MSPRRHIGPEDRRRKGERRFWERVANQYDSWISSSFPDQYTVYNEVLTDHLAPEDRVLEIGTGTGKITMPLAESANHIVGVDISPGMIAVAEEKRRAAGIDNIEFHVADAYGLPFEEGSFDKVIAVNVLQILKEPERVVAEAVRVLRPGGEFLNITYCYRDSSIWDLFKLARWAIRFGIPRYWSNLHCREIREWFETNGLTVLESDRIWDRPVVLFLRGRK
jgi:ubiquinone/menaquinone biosynthesis C-methylase UbiE